MNWYYYDGANQVGPISEAELLQARQSGVINDNSIVWREGLTNWIPYREAFPSTASSAASGVPPQFAAGEGQAQCCECRNYFSVADMIRHGQLFVCGNCKPIFLQRIREGATSSSARLLGGFTEAQVRERDYHHSVGEYLSKSWALFKTEPGLILGAFCLVGLCLIVANVTPYLSMITSIVFTGPLLGGLILFYLKKQRGQPATLGDAFSGFGPRFGQLLLGNFVPGLLVGLMMIPAIILIMIGVFVLVVNRGGISPGAGFGVKIVIVMLLKLSFWVIIYFQTCWLFTLWLVADKNMSFWPAMSLSRAVVRKHWWKTLWMGIVAGFLLLGGFLVCFAGLLVTAPLALGMFAYAYEKLFGDMQPE